MSNKERLSILVDGGTTEERVQLHNLVGNLLQDALGSTISIGYLNGVRGLFEKRTEVLAYKGITLDITELAHTYDRESHAEVCNGDYAAKVILFGETLYLGHDVLTGSFRTARRFDKLVEIANEHEEIVRFVNAYLFNSYPDLSKMPEDSTYVVEIWSQIGEFDATRLSAHVFPIQNSVPKAS